MNTIKVMAQDLKPKSAPHLIRIIISTLMILAALAIAIIKVLTTATFDKNDVYVILGFGGAGFVTLFTNTALEVAKTLLPWKKSS